MKPVIQTKTEFGKGNCLAACIASILEIEIDVIPDLKSGENFKGLKDFLAERGIVPIWIHNKTLGTSYVGYSPGFCILIGDSPRSEKVHHAVVAKPNGYGYDIVHDPHPEGGGLKGEPHQAIYFGAKL
jgi:hypothetical protein